MNDFVRCNKLSGVYWLQGPVNKLRVRITLKPPDDIITLPKFEEYASETGDMGLERDTEEFTFKWQEKSFSECEIQHYRDVHNCLTENELGYHELINSKEIIPSKVFTYIHEDYHTPLPQTKTKVESLLSSCLERLSLESAVGGVGRSASEKQLFSSREDISEKDERWTAMHVLLDNSDYKEEEPVVKQEATLLSLFHNTTHNYLVLSPDVSRPESSPYSAETSAGEPLARLYGVHVDLGGEAAGGDLDSLLVQLRRACGRRGGPRAAPGAGGARLLLTLELVAARGFPADALYVEYHVELPEGVRCRAGALRGRTHVAAGAGGDCHFGHVLELCLETDAALGSARCALQLEVVSRDARGRHRTEGLGALALPLAPRALARALRCVRPAERPARAAAERRFFLGGSRLLPRAPAPSAPADYTCTETGRVLLRAAVLRCAAGPAPGPGAGPAGAAALLVGAEAALRRYRRARSRLARARSVPGEGGAGPPRPAPPSPRDIHLYT